jgi:Protein of unknown function (DUF2550)
MIIALLALLGVNVVVLVVLMGMVIARRRWVSQRSGAFRGAVRVATGAIDGLGDKWNRGYGRWVRDILVWTRGPLLLRNELVVTDDFAKARSAAHGEVKGLRSAASVLSFLADGAVVEVAVGMEDIDLAAGPYGPAGGGPSPGPTAPGE